MNQNSGKELIFVPVVDSDILHEHLFTAIFVNCSRISVFSTSSKLQLPITSTNCCCFLFWFLFLFYGDQNTNEPPATNYDTLKTNLLKGDFKFACLLKSLVPYSCSSFSISLSSSIPPI